MSAILKSDLDVSHSRSMASDRHLLNSTHALPSSSPWLLGWFTSYSRRYIRKHFHSVRVSLAGLPPSNGGLPLVVYSNHASWWDPLMCLVLKDEFFQERTAFAPIDATMLARYKFLGRLGFFGVEQGTRRGAARFLRTADAILNGGQNILAVTPQSRFADVRERPVRFAPGLGHLATRVERAVFLPLAVEYVFWEERLPELLVRFGDPLEICLEDRRGIRSDDWSRCFEHNLAKTQDSLALESQRRRTEDFRVVLRGGAGQGGVYDLWRFLKSRIRGKEFQKEHGTL